VFPGAVPLKLPFHRPGELIGTGGTTGTAADTLEFFDKFRGIHAFYQRGHGFKVSVTAVLKRNMVNLAIPDIEVDLGRAGSCRVKVIHAIILG
jgi:hypothetical protein